MFAFFVSLQILRLQLHSIAEASQGEREIITSGCQKRKKGEEERKKKRKEEKENDSSLRLLLVHFF